MPRIYEQAKGKKKEHKIPMENITINIPEAYEKKLQELISLKIITSRSEGIRLAIREYLVKEYKENLKLLGFSEGNNLKIARSVEDVPISTRNVKSKQKLKII